ncbi:MAG: hypothetical protein ACXWPS_05945, partial [Ktedonobacteraceae bacterium]
MHLPGRSWHPCHRQGHRRSLQGLRTVPGARFAACDHTGHDGAGRSRFISGALLEAIRVRGAQVLGRLPQGVFTHKEQVLPGG